MGFKDQLSADLAVFFNPEEFSDVHNIDERNLSVIVDNDRLKERSQKEYDGITIGEILFFVKATDYGSRPEVGAPIVFDGRQMFVFNAREDMGLYEIILSQNRSV